MADTLEDGYDKLPELKYDSMSIKELIGEARRTAPAMTAHDESFERLKEVIETRKKEHLLKATKENDDTMDIMMCIVFTVVIVATLLLGDFNILFHSKSKTSNLQRRICFLADGCFVMLICLLMIMAKKKLCEVRSMYPIMSSEQLARYRRQQDCALRKYFTMLTFVAGMAVGMCLMFLMCSKTAKLAALAQVLLRNGSNTPPIPPQL
ncbi:unnamed protein product [Caenorhabditis brenneri]